MADEIVRRPPGASRLLARILDDPALVRTVRTLEPRALGRLIDHVGLEDAGELVALATTEQLQRIFDDDLWSAPQPGQEERFSPERFALWLEVMLEAGPRFAAEKLTELPEELVALAMHRLALVVDLDALAVEMAEAGDDDDLVEKALEGCLYEEFDEFRVMSRRHEGWDALVTVMMELDESQHDWFVGLLERCAHASQEYIEDNGGLYAVLTSEEMLEADAAGEREDRRAAEGYVSPADAAAFLKHAKVTPLEQLAAAADHDPITRAYFRRYERRARPGEGGVGGDGGDGGDASATPLAELLAEAEVAPPSRPLLGAGDDAREPLVTRALAALAVRDPEAHERRVDELGYLANVLLAGATKDGRRYRPFEAAEAALQVCNRGLVHLVGPDAAVDRACERLRTDGADKLFRIGWHLAG